MPYHRHTLKPLGTKKMGLCFGKKTHWQHYNKTTNRQTQTKRRNCWNTLTSYSFSCVCHNWFVFLTLFHSCRVCTTPRLVWNRLCAFRCRRGSNFPLSTLRRFITTLGKYGHTRFHGAGGAEGPRAVGPRGRGAAGPRGGGEAAGWGRRRGPRGPMGPMGLMRHPCTDLAMIQGGLTLRYLYTSMQDENHGHDFQRQRQRRWGARLGRARFC